MRAQSANTVVEVQTRGIPCEQGRAHRNGSEIYAFFPVALSLNPAEGRPRKNRLGDDGPHFARRCRVSGRIARVSFGQRNSFVSEVSHMIVD